MPFCLNKQSADKFREALRKREIDPEKLSEMSSDERRKFFNKIVGEENAKDVNVLFESKLLLKNRQQGYVNWAKNLTNVHSTVRDGLIEKINKLDKVLSPAEESAFLKDLAEKKLGVGVDVAEAQKIADLAKTIREKKTVLGSGGDRLEYGEAMVALNNYVDELKLNANKITLADIRRNPGQSLLQGVAAAPGFTKSILASMDNSAIFRQGWRAAFTNPHIWAQNAAKSFSDLTTLRGQEKVMDALNADILSRSNSLNNYYRKSKLDVGIGEEAFPTSLPEKVPVLGRLYKASENAYGAFVRKTRADVFDKYIEIAQKNDIELDDNQLLMIGRMVNSLTGRGHLGRGEQIGSAVNSVFFSPKNLKSQIDHFTQPLTGGATLTEIGKGEQSGSNFVRKQAALNLTKTVVGMAAIMAISKSLISAFGVNGNVELDPRSAEFGKIRIRDTRFDVSGGFGSLVTLAARIVTVSKKSSVTGNITLLNERDKNGKPKFGGDDLLDLMVDFTENKLSPIAGVFRDYAKGETKDGKQPTALNQAMGMITPLPIKTGYELWTNPNAAPFAAGMLADFLGSAANTYSSPQGTLKQIQDAQKRGDGAEVERLKKVLAETQKLEQQKLQEGQKAETENRKAEKGSLLNSYINPNKTPDSIRKEIQQVRETLGENPPMEHRKLVSDKINALKKELSEIVKGTREEKKK